MNNEAHDKALGPEGDDGVRDDTMSAIVTNATAGYKLTEEQKREVTRRIAEIQATRKPKR